MKTLLVMRHAKSSWKDETVPDHDRPLNRRGLRSASKMGKWIRRRHLLPDVLLCSTAMRARQTCELLREQWEAPVEPRYLAELYHCPAERFVDVLRPLPDAAERVLLIGHNPGMADFLAAAVGCDEKFPTAALAELHVDIAAWRELTADAPWRLIHIWRPRELG